jgi:hypothetical protein
LRRTGFCTMPLRIALALTLMRTTRPFTTARDLLDVRLELARGNAGGLGPDAAEVLRLAAMGPSGYRTWFSYQ